MLIFLLWSKSTLCALSIAVVASPQTVKLTEVHVRQDPARLVGLRRLAASLAEEASVPGAGAGALRLGVGRLERGSGALAAGKRVRTEEGRGERWLVGGGGCRDGHQGGDGGARRNGGHRGDGRIRETAQRGGERKRTGGRRAGGKIHEGIGNGKTRERTEGVRRDFREGLQNLQVGLVGGVMGHAEGSRE